MFAKLDIIVQNSWTNCFSEDPPKWPYCQTGKVKEYGGSKKLGQTFKETVVNVKFATESSKFPFLRSAMMATNLISPKDKIVDGHARLLTKSDVQSIAKKATLMQATAAEQLLAECWKSLQTLSQENKLTIP